MHVSRTRDTFAGGALAAWSTGLCAFRAGGGGAPRAETRRQRARRGVGEPVGAGGQGADVTQAPRRSPGGPGGSAGSESGLEMDCSPGLGPWSFARGGGGLAEPSAPAWGGSSADLVRGGACGQTHRRTEGRAGAEQLQRRAG